MTNAAPRRVAAGSLPAESDASNRAVATVGSALTLDMGAGAFDVFSTASVRTAAFRTIEFSNVDLDTACSTAAFSTADLDAAFSDAACSTTDLSAAACSTAGFSKADHDAAFSADTSTTATAIAPRSLDRVRNQLGLTSTLVQVELVGLPLPRVRRSAPRRRDHAISGWFGLQMTSAAPRRVAAGSPPAKSDASNRAVATVGAVALHLEGIVDGPRHAQQERASGVHESSLVPLVPEDMVVMNVVARDNVSPVAANHSSLPHLAVEEDLHLRANRQHGVGRGVQLDVVLDVVTSIGYCCRHPVATTVCRREESREVALSICTPARRLDS
jgi:hypothetical protein